MNSKTKTKNKGVKTPFFKSGNGVTIMMSALLVIFLIMCLFIFEKFYQNYMSVSGQIVCDTVSDGVAAYMLQNEDASYEDAYNVAKEIARLNEKSGITYKNIKINKEWLLEEGKTDVFLEVCADSKFASDTRKANKESYHYLTSAHSTTIYSSWRTKMIKWAKECMNRPNEYSNSPRDEYLDGYIHRTDCSGFVSACFAHVGAGFSGMPCTSTLDQYFYPINESEVKKGDIYLVKDRYKLANGQSCGHVVLYIGGDMVIEMGGMSGNKIGIHSWSNYYDRSVYKPYRIKEQYKPSGRLGGELKTPKKYVSEEMFTDEEWDLMCAVVYHEAGPGKTDEETRRNAKAVMSIIINRIDSKYAGFGNTYTNTGIIGQITAPGQFASYFGGYYQSVLGKVPQPAITGIRQALAGENSFENEEYNAFRTASQSAMRAHPQGVKIGGNWFFKD